MSEITSARLQHSVNYFATNRTFNTRRTLPCLLPSDHCLWRSSYTSTCKSSMTRHVSWTMQLPLHPLVCAVNSTRRRAVSTEPERRPMTAAGGVARLSGIRQSAILLADRLFGPSRLSSIPQRLCLSWVHVKLPPVSITMNALSRGFGVC